MFLVQPLLKEGPAVISDQVVQGFIQLNLENIHGCMGGH